MSTLLLGAALLALVACSGFQTSRSGGANPAPRFTFPIGRLAAVPDRTFGTGPVKVALLLPLSDPDLKGLAASMANGALLAVDFIDTNANIADNITMVVKDIGTMPDLAGRKAGEAIAEGASIILGPIRPDAVAAVASVARERKIPVIAFANVSSAAAPGVYLLNVLPETEQRRIFAYAQRQARKKIAGIFPSGAYGAAQQAAFAPTLARLKLEPAGQFTIANDGEARALLARLAPQIESGAIEALYLPDRRSARAIANMLQGAGIAPDKLMILGAADWDADSALAQVPALAGAVYPAIDPAGYQALRAQYLEKFGSEPDRMATIAYTATVLANVPSLSMANPKYPASQLTLAAGYNGRDGVFRFHADGTSDYALVIKQLASGTTQVIEAGRL